MLALPGEAAVATIPNAPLASDSIAKPAETPEEFAARLDQIRETGIIYESLIRAEIPAEKARDLEKRLTSSNEEVRKKAYEELNEKYKIADVEKAMKGKPGGAGAWAIVIEKIAAAVSGGNSGTPPPRPRGK